jgi:hypothetical protein
MIYVENIEDASGDLVEVAYFDSRACWEAWTSEQGIAAADVTGGLTFGVELDYPVYCPHCDSLVSGASLTPDGVSYVLENLETWSASRVADLVREYDLRDNARREMYRRFRVKYSGMRARDVWRWADSWIDMLAERAELDWTESGGNLSANLRREGFDVTVYVKPDYDTWPDGDFTDNPSADSVAIPDTYRERNSFRYYTPVCSYREHRASLTKLGYARGVAHELATRYVREEMERNVRQDRAVYMIGASASREGIELGRMTIGGYEIDADASYSETISTLTDAVIENGVIDEAVSEARQALARLNASPFAEGAALESS